MLNMLLNYLWKTFRLVLITVVTILCFKTFFFETGRVNGVSMVPTFQDNETFLINKYALLFSSPARQQLVQCKNPLNGKLLIKRIIGIPGDTVHIHNNIITVDTAEKTTITLNESYLGPGTITQMWNNESGDIPLGRDEYFVLGDNRRESGDSRHFGSILRKDILGTIVKLP